MSYKLFIDDERFPPAGSWVIARSSQEAIDVVETNGTPDFISFDHDLGGDDTSMTFIQWLITRTLDGVGSFPKEYYVHSQNCVGCANITGLMESFLKFHSASSVQHYVGLERI